MARDYELGIIVNPDVGDDQARAIVERITQTVASDEGQVVRVNAWGRRRLAYPIERHRDGLYFFFDMILDPDATSELERTIRVNEDILRHLLKVRDPRVVTQQRQREADADAQAAAQAEAQAAQAAEAAARAPAPTEAAPTEAAPTEAPAGAEAEPESEAAEPAAEVAETAPAPAAAPAPTEETEPEAAEPEGGEEESVTAEPE
ncbi:MAG TPA: 30S ribosomal protein S6, partial [Ktedonobacterales bacterium]|nr:30S ribosomal protein S6 [Ktedonobacterales bacterium]